jgi:hypothetical protein
MRPAGGSIASAPAPIPDELTMTTGRDDVDSARPLALAALSALAAALFDAVSTLAGVTAVAGRSATTMTRGLAIVGRVALPPDPVLVAGRGVDGGCGCNIAPAPDCEPPDALRDAVVEVRGRLLLFGGCCD